MGKSKKKENKHGSMVKRFWGNDIEEYNTVASTQCYMTFEIMQVFRMLSVLTLLGLMAANCYIYVKRILTDYNFWSLLFTFLAMLFLFIGSGKQVVY